MFPLDLNVDHMLMNTYFWVFFVEYIIFFCAQGKNKVVITLNKPLPDVHEPGKKFDVYFSNGVTSVKAVGELLQNRCSIKLLAPPSPTKGW